MCGVTQCITNGGYENMVGNETNVNAQPLAVLRQYQGNSYGSQPGSRGEPQGHYRILDVSTGVFSARDNTFNGYLQARFVDDVLTLYQGRTPPVSLEGIANQTTGHSGSKREYVGDKMIEIIYWSNGMSGTILPHKRGYSLTIRVEGTQEEVDALKPRLEAYLGQLQQSFGLESTNKVDTKREAA